METACFLLPKIVTRLIVGAALTLGSDVTCVADETVGGVERTLEAIPTILGLSAYGRMKACGMQIAQSSFAKFSPGDLPNLAVRNGDGILNVMLILPPIPGATAPDPGLYRDIVARWYVRNGKAFAYNGWAQRIEYQPTPLEWMNC